MGLYPIDENYDLSTWYENVGAYDLHTGTDLMLDLARRILISDAYIFQGVSFPKGNDTFIPMGNTFSGTLNLVPYSYVLSVTGWSGNGNQFTIRIYDKGAQTDVYQKQFAWFPSVVSNMTGQANLGQNILQNDRNKPFGVYFFRDPLIILPPGVLQVQLTNVGMPSPFPGPSGVEHGFVQCFFNIAVPKNTVSLQTRSVLHQQDPTGTQTLQGVAGVTGLLNAGGSM